MFETPDHNWSSTNGLEQAFESVLCCSDQDVREVSYTAIHLKQSKQTHKRSTSDRFVKEQSVMERRASTQCWRSGSGLLEMPKFMCAQIFAVSVGLWSMTAAKYNWDLGIIIIKQVACKVSQIWALVGLSEQV